MEKFSLPMNMEARGYYNPVIEAVKTRAYQEIVYMTKILNKPADSQPFIEIVFNLMQLLDQAAFLLNSGAIDPWVEICTAPHDTEKPLYDKTLRIGVYPVAANPFHWAHLLIGLSVLTRFKLDKIIYVITGHDPRKPSMVAAEIRHLIGEEVLKIFTPLFGYSSMALENDLDGETNIFEILALNPEQKIEAFYIVGSDHYHRVNPKTGRIDTIQKIENNLRSKTGMLDDDVHSVSVIFIERGSRNHFVETNLNTAFIPELPFAASSTMIREVFQEKRKQQTLALMPYTAYKYAEAFGLYGSNNKFLMRDKQQYQNQDIGFATKESTITVFARELLPVQ